MRLPLSFEQYGRLTIFSDAEGKKRRGPRPPSGAVGFVAFHPFRGAAHGYAPIPDSLIRLLDSIKQRQTYIGQFEMVAAIAPYISLPREWFEGMHVEHWLDSSHAIGSLLKGYAGAPDTAHIVNTFRCAVAKLSLRSIWLDYVNTESNIADIPSRVGEAPASGDEECWAMMGDRVHCTIPQFADEHGEWLSFAAVAMPVLTS